MKRSQIVKPYSDQHYLTVRCDNGNELTLVRSASKRAGNGFLWIGDGCGIDSQHFDTVTGRVALRTLAYAILEETKQRSARRKKK